MISLKLAGPVATITMSRSQVNAINPEFVTAFGRLLDEVERAQPTILVIDSDQNCFCAGADLTLIRGFVNEASGTEAMIAYVRTLHAWFDRLERLDAITLACIGGPALGGGLEMALACDLRIATTDAKLGLPEARVGMIPGAGGTQRLSRLCGPGVSARLILGGEVVDGAEALRLGIVQWAVPRDAFQSTTDAIVARVAGLSRPALVASKVCIAAWFDPAADGFAYEIEAPRGLMAEPETRTFVERFFARSAT